MEFWDIYDKDKKPTGRTMKKNDWILKDGEYHLSVLGVIHRPDGRFLITQRVMTKAWALKHDGGEYTMGMAYLAAWQGPVYDADDPYGDGVTRDDLAAVKHVQQMLIIDGKDYQA